MLKKWWLLLVVFAAAAGSAQNQLPGDAVYQAVRTNNLAALRTLVAAHGVNAQDKDGYTPLVLASAFGTLDAVQLLVEAGADVNSAAANGITALHVAVRDPRKVRLLLARGAKVNVTSLASSTPLIVAGSTHGASESVRLLLDAGADVKPADRNGVTALLAAALVDDAASVELLLKAGADTNVRSTSGSVGSPLIAAASNGNAHLVRLILSKKADVNGAAADIAGIVKNGNVEFGRVTALHAATIGGSVEATKLLLDAGASIDPLDIRGMTPLMIAVGTDHPTPEIVKLLRARGADTSMRSKAGETVIDWARKFNNPAVLNELGLTRSAIAEPALSADSRLNAQSAVERSLPLLRTTSAGVQTEGGCVACHAQPLTALAARLAEGRGWKAAGPTTAFSQQQTTQAGSVPSLLQPIFAGGAPDGQVYGGLMLALAHVPAAVSTDALAYYLAAMQQAEGRWHGGAATRAPMQDGDISRTAFAVRILAEYGTPALKEEFAERIARAVGWLNRQTPSSTPDLALQVLGLVWGGADTRARDKHVQALLALQRPNGGWGQTPNLPADAYATGQALYALRESGVRVPDAAFSKGTSFLLGTQKPDGSWHVVNRAMKIQPYFESGFPYGHDQWISHAGTAWAAMALAGMQ